MREVTTTIFNRPFTVTNVRPHPQIEDLKIIEGYFTDDPNDLTKNPGANILVAYPETVLYDKCNKCTKSFPVAELQFISCEGVYCSPCHDYVICGGYDA